MSAIRGKYRLGKIELEEPIPPEIECADLNIVVIPTKEHPSQSLPGKNQHTPLIVQVAEKVESDDDPEEDRIWESYSK